jgi:hypothetical protein
MDGRAGVWVSHQVISDEGEAAQWGMHGSPTLLIDGADPFAEPGQPPSMSCRLYRDENGQLSGAPSLGQLRQAIEQAPAAAPGLDPPAEVVSQAFWHACTSGQRRAAEYPLSRGADLNWEPDYAHGTPLDAASGHSTQQENVITWLRAMGANSASAD